MKDFPSTLAKRYSEQSSMHLTWRNRRNIRHYTNSPPAQTAL